MSDKIPEELLCEVLKYNFSIGPIHDSFSDSAKHVTDVSHDGQFDMPPSAALLVSTRWLRVGTPLFYRTVIIKSIDQVRQLGRVLKANPYLGALVRNLRLEGGYGRELLAVVKHMTQVDSLSLNAYAKSKDTKAGLVRALPLLNPTRLYLHGLRRWESNKNTTALRDALFEAWSTWTSLVSASIAG